jgi:hypothetical protein
MFGRKALREGEWLSTFDVLKMLEFVRSRRAILSHEDGKPDRVGRRLILNRISLLFACACLRRVWHLLVDPRSRSAVEACEASVDFPLADDVKKLVVAEAAAARVEVERAFLAEKEPNSWRPAAYYQAAAVSEAAWGAELVFDDTGKCCLASSSAAEYELFVANDVRFHVAPAYDDSGRELVAQTRLLRDIVGYPFHRVPIEQIRLVQNDSHIVRLAGELYVKGASSTMAMLGDALRRAGCDERRLLDHCFSDDEHVRGCWVLDAILQKRPVRAKSP